MDDHTEIAGAIRPDTSSPARQSNSFAFFWAILSVIALILWQAATVRYNYGGNWTGLYCTSAKAGVPDELQSENIYLFPTDGWDGQFYHYIAHDPLIQRDLWKHIDAPRLRYKRILVPALAHLLAFGNPAGVDPAYRAVILLFAFLGVYWLAALAKRNGRHPAWGLAFCLLPASIVSIDRMAVDIALGALCFGFVFYLGKAGHREIPLYVILLCASLVRDTGFFLVAAWCGWLLWKRHYGKAVLFATAAIPAVIWYNYVNAHTLSFVYHSPVSVPFTGLLDRFVSPMTYPSSGSIAPIIMLLDYISLFGLIHALLLAVRVIREFRITPITLAIGIFALLMVLVWSPGDWLEAYDYGRICSPLLALLALRALESSDWIYCIPLFLMLPRFGVQMASQVFHVIRGILPF